MRIFVIHSTMMISGKKKAPFKTFRNRTFSSLPLESSYGLIIGDFTSYFLKSDDFKNPKFYYAHN